MTCPQKVNADKIYWYVILRLPLNQQTFLACVTRHASSLKEKKKSLVCQRSPRCRVDFPALRPGNTMLTSCQGFQSWGKTHIYTLGHILAKYLYASIHVGFKCCWLFDLKPILPYHISRAHLVLMLLWGGFIPPHWWWNLKEQALKPRDITGDCLIYTGLHVSNDPKRNHQVIVINIGKRSQLCLISFIKKKKHLSRPIGSLLSCCWSNSWYQKPKTTCE